MTEPLNWRALVAETLRRRKQEGLTQQQHAALANVSRPTILAFDKGEASLSLAKAFDILRVVGLLAATPSNDAQDRFVAESLARWHRLIADLPADSPARFPHGGFICDYHFTGDTALSGLKDFLQYLLQAQDHHGNWPPFWIPQSRQIAPRIIDDMLQCWLAPDTAEDMRYRTDPEDCDFWCAALPGRLFLYRGYHEDSARFGKPGQLFNLGLATRVTAELLHHAARLGQVLLKNPEQSEIHFRLTFNGLQNRVLQLQEGEALQREPYSSAKSCETHLSLKFSSLLAAQSDDPWINLLSNLLGPLYKSFGIPASASTLSAVMRK